MTNNKRSEQPRNVLPDLIIPCLALGFTVYYLTTITEVPWISQASAVTVSGLLLLAIAAFVIRTVHRIRHGQETLELGLKPAVGSVNLRRVALLVLTIAYVVFIETLGFSLITFIFVFFGIVLLSSLRNWKAAALVALSCSVIGYFVFIYFFKTRFPKGVIENTLQSLL